ncbi:aldoxime dehydratase [Kribbella sp. VKM Ac-2527]|uniref:Aldoxime dehydratase n=1 Tax=Kribbella caucasensis TaxID=2512215 RepID=A0A4R6KEH4_9ACTN|nr:phenylacetaldoxime dehydratase family protein [Kribbella sp. VKM Ac-2527]TDO48011.1 aldoxime dehydratase [Kribbella sp. VKM Ac-2527]
MSAETSTLESSIAPHLLREGRSPKHKPGAYQPPYPSFSARFGEDVTAVVMAYFGVQVRDADDPALAASLADMRQRFAATDGPAYWDRARYVDADGYTTVIGIAYWVDKAAFDAWYSAEGAPWTDPARVADGVGHFLELVTPSVDRLETIFSANDKVEGVAGAGTGMSGMIEEHAYWGSMRDRLPLSQGAPLYPEGTPRIVEDGPVCTVVLHENACVIRSGQDLTETGETERSAYLAEVEPSLREGMDFLRDQGNGIGCYDNRYMTVLDENDQPTLRTFGVSWWRDLSALEDWAASHPTHVQIFGVAMRHLSSFGPESRLRLYHEVTVPAATEQRFVYVGCHARTGMLRAVS